MRPTLEYDAGHIAGARSDPDRRLGDAIDALPRSREIIAYCRGPYCVYADDAVRLLHAKGFKARRLDTGYPEWDRAGLPTETDHQAQSRMNVLVICQGPAYGDERTYNGTGPPRGESGGLLA